MCVCGGGGGCLVQLLLKTGLVMLLPAAMAAGCDEARAAASTTELHHQQHHQHHHQQQCCERVDSVAPTHEVQASQSIEEAVVQNGQPFCRWPRHPDLTRDVDHRRPWVGSPRITHNMVGFENGRKGSCPSRIPRRIGPASRDSAAEARVRRRARPQPLAAEETNGNMGRRLQDRRPPPRQQGRPAPASRTASPRPAPVRRRPTVSKRSLSRHNGEPTTLYHYYHLIKTEGPPKQSVGLGGGESRPYQQMMTHSGPTS